MWSAIKKLLDVNLDLPAFIGVSVAFEVELAKVLLNEIERERESFSFKTCAVLIYKRPPYVFQKPVVAHRALNDTVYELRTMYLPRLLVVYHEHDIFRQFVCVFKNLPLEFRAVDPNIEHPC